MDKQYTVAERIEKGIEITNEMHEYGIRFVFSDRSGAASITLKVGDDLDPALAAGDIGEAEEVSRTRCASLKEWTLRVKLGEVSISQGSGYGVTPEWAARAELAAAQKIVADAQKIVEAHEAKENAAKQA